MTVTIITNIINLLSRIGTYCGYISPEPPAGIGDEETVFDFSRSEELNLVSCITEFGNADAREAA